MYRVGIAPRSRILAFGSAGLLVVAGTLSAALIDGFTGELIATILILLGLLAIVLLLFYEVGLSEDHEREREARRTTRPSSGPPRRPRLHRPPRRRG